MNIAKISDAEYEIMKIIWESNSELTSSEIKEGLGKSNSWKDTTILTLARRLVDKNILSVRKEGRINYYCAKVTKDEYKSYHADGFIDEMYDGSVKSLIASLYDNEKIDEEDIRELGDWLRRL